MMHPDTELRFIDDRIGFGVFATAPIPKGTIIWAKDPLDQYLSPEAADALPANVRERALTHMFRDAGGRYVLCWDLARYINHSFFPTCTITHWDFDIAITDINPGKQLTEDYGTLNIIEPFEPFHEPGSERRTVTPDDLKYHYQQWDAALAAALPLAIFAPQPLLNLVPKDIWNLVRDICDGKKPMPSFASCHFSG
ncbi:MAG: SET domain-containing protein [Oscillatoria princeps RMCB-10]|jgi:hypothetical protein|nr:SET domain-containing protein [Oscillatoria princeps RMCB-10]